MSEPQEKKLRGYCAQVLTKYGFEFSPYDPVIPALYTIYCELNSNKIGNEQVAKMLRAGLEQINPTVYNFNAKGEAWKFKFAESLRWLFLGVSCVAVIFIALLWWRQSNDVRRAREILVASSGAHRMLMMAAERDKNGFIYVELSKARGRFIKNFTEYDEVKKDTIRLYFGKAE